MQRAPNILGIDFSTSNSAASNSIHGNPFIIELKAGKQTLPKSIFFDFESWKTIFATPANGALISGFDGRYMGSFKSVLGTSLMHEPRRIWAKH